MKALMEHLEKDILAFKKTYGESKKFNICYYPYLGKVVASDD
jgi:hypothetical protein